MSTTSLFIIYQGPSESLREYLTLFNETTIKVILPNQEMFMGAFRNRIREWQFNESFAYRPSTSLAEMVKHAKYYIKGGESNTKKNAKYIKEQTIDNLDSSK